MTIKELKHGIFILNIEIKINFFLVYFIVSHISKGLVELQLKNIFILIKKKILTLI